MDNKCTCVRLVTYDGHLRCTLEEPNGTPGTPGSTGKNFLQFRSSSLLGDKFYFKIAELVCKTLSTAFSLIR